jgi:hypothetical protein
VIQARAVDVQGGAIGTNQVDVNLINSALNTGTSVTLDTGTAPGESPRDPGDITQQAGAAILKTAGGNATLTLNAENDISLSEVINATFGQLNVVLNADSDTSGAGGCVPGQFNYNKRRKR